MAAKKKTPAAAAKNAAPVAASQPVTASKGSPELAKALDTLLPPPESPAASLAAATGKKTRRPKISVDWSETPWGVFRRNKSKPVAVSKDKAGILKAIEGLPVSKQEQCFVAEFKPVKITSQIVI